MLMCKYRNEIVEKINSLCLYGCEEIKCGDVLYYTIRMEEEHGIFQLIKQVIILLKSFLFDTNNYELCGDANTLFFFGSSSARRDMYSKFIKLKAAVHNRLYINPFGKYKIRRHTLRNIGSLRISLYWSTQLKDILTNPVERLRQINILYRAYCDYKSFLDYEKRNNLHITKLVTLCDLQATESYFTQMFNRDSKLTISLQHGTYSSVDNPYEFRGIKSKIFLADGYFSKDEAKIAGISEKCKVIPVGLLTSIGVKKQERPDKYGNHTIGLALEAESRREDNIKSIEFMAQFCKNHNKRLVLRFHPTSPIDNYKPILKKYGIVDYCSKEVSVKDFAKMIDIGITRYSTMLLDLLDLWIPTFLYVSEGQLQNTYKNYTMLNFSNERELSNLIENINENTVSELISNSRQYFICAGDTLHNYQEVLGQYGIS